LVLLAPGCDFLDKAKGGDSGSEAKSAAAEVSAKSESKEEWKAGTNTPPPPAEPPAGSWIGFESKEGGFKAEFPSSPKTESTQMPVANVTVEMVTYSAELDDVYYAVATTDFPEEIVSAKPPAVLLDGARDGAVANIGGKLKEEKQIEIDGNAARRIVITGNAEGHELVVDSVIFLKDKRLYQGIVVRPAGKEATTEVNRFLDSLHPV
jgi:hypothetical protein